MARRRTSQPLIPYTPDKWTPEQAQAHIAADLDEAMHHASRLAGGWYGRAVTIDFQVTEDNDERYMLRPAEVPPLQAWTPAYTISKAICELCGEPAGEGNATCPACAVSR